MDSGEARIKLSEARVARLATVSASGLPHVVPIVFVIDGDTLYFAVDSKPKRTVDLQRLRNIGAHPNVSILVDHYEDESWAKLWWVRGDGIARVVDDTAEAGRAIDMLAAKYRQHQDARPNGPVVAVVLQQVSGWSGA